VNSEAKRNAGMVLGAAANVANNVVSFSHCDFYGVVGEDKPGRDIKTLLKERNIGAKLIFDSQRDTILKNRFSDSDGSCLLRLDEEEGFPIALSEVHQEEILNSLKERIRMLETSNSSITPFINDDNKRKEEENKKSEERRELIMELANVGVFSVKRKNDILKKLSKLA